MGWYQDIKEILQRNSEPWLAYLVGQKLESDPSFARVHLRYRGYYIRCLVFLYRQLIKTRLSNKLDRFQKQPCYFFYAGSANQMDSLASTIDYLRNQGESVVSIA